MRPQPRAAHRRGLPDDAPDPPAGAASRLARAVEREAHPPARSASPATATESKAKPDAGAGRLLVRAARRRAMTPAAAQAGGTRKRPTPSTMPEAVPDTASDGPEGVGVEGQGDEDPHGDEEMPQTSSAWAIEDGQRRCSQPSRGGCGAAPAGRRGGGRTPAGRARGRADERAPALRGPGRAERARAPAGRRLVVTTVATTLTASPSWPP